MIMHKHHIVPKHAGGTDDPSNLLKCNVAMHAFMHKLRYEETGDEYDKIAWKALSGQIPNAQAARESFYAFWNSPEKSKQAREKMSKAKTGTKLSDSHRQAIADAHRGMKRSSEAKRAMSEAAVKRYNHVWVGTCLKTGNTVRLNGIDLKEMGFDVRNVTKVVSGKRKSHGGYTWTKEVNNGK